MRFTKLYVIAIISVVATIALNQILVHTSVQNRNYDVHHISLAGTQRMLSQMMATIACNQSNSEKLVVFLKEVALHFDSVPHVLLHPNNNLSQAVSDDSLGTQKLNLENEIEKSRQIADIHEVRGPVISKLGLVNLMAKERKPTETRELVYHPKLCCKTRYEYSYDSPYLKRH